MSIDYPPDYAAGILRDYTRGESYTHAQVRAALRAAVIDRPRVLGAMVAADNASAALSSPADAAAYMRERWESWDVECLGLLILTTGNRARRFCTLTRGSDRFTVVDPRQVYRIALHHRASAIILAHNHPSGSTSPSPQDIDVTGVVAAAGRAIGIPLHDHIILTAGGSYLSLAEEGYC